MFSRTEEILLKPALLFITLMGITEQNSSFIFRAMKLSNGSAMCTLDAPTMMELMPLGSYIRCLKQCVNQMSCQSINYYSDTGQCDMYDTWPRSVRIISGCTGYMNAGEFPSFLLKTHHWIIPDA
jgi:PAN domain